MSETKYSLEEDLKEARAMADGLDVYVRGNDLYGRAGSGGLFALSRMPSLTVGALRMRLRRLNALRDQLTPAQQAELDKVIERDAAVHAEWRAHYDAKMEREALSRLKLMNTFFEELRDNPRLATSAYSPEALRRTIVQELIDAMREANMPVDAPDAMKAGVDNRLRRWFEPSGKFLWADKLAPAYPEKPYWWLYIRPRADAAPG